jgi:threonine dehydrogenase-like Zn-dependent dehydrogenase
MQPELALKAVSHTVIAIFLLTLLFVLLISLRKKLSGDAPVRGIVHLGLGVIGICTFVALMAAYFQTRKVILPQSNSQRLDTATVSQPAAAT